MGSPGAEARRWQGALNRTGRPGHAQLPDWESHTADSRATMVFGRDCYLGDAPLETERVLWERWA